MIFVDFVVMFHCVVKVIHTHLNKETEQASADIDRNIEVDQCIVVASEFCHTTYECDVERGCLLMCYCQA